MHVQVLRPKPGILKLCDQLVIVLHQSRFILIAQHQKEFQLTMCILEPSDLFKIILDHRTDARILFLRLFPQQHRDMIVDLYRHEYVAPIDGETDLIEDDAQVVHDTGLYITRIDEDVPGCDLQTDDTLPCAAVSYMDRVSIDHLDI